MIASIVLLILDEYRLYAYLYTLFILITVIQLYRLRRARHRLDWDYVQIRQAIAEYQKNRDLNPHEPQHATGDALNDLREEIERHKNEV